MSDAEHKTENEELYVSYGQRIIGTLTILGFVALTLAAIFTFVTGALSLTAAFAMSMVAVGCSLASFFVKIYYDYTYGQKAWINYYRSNQHSSFALGIGSLILAVTTIVAIIFLTGGLSALGTHGIQGISSPVIGAISGIQTVLEFAGSILALGALLYTGIMTILDRKEALTGYELISQKAADASNSHLPHISRSQNLLVQAPKTTSPLDNQLSQSGNSPGPS